MAWLTANWFSVLILVAFIAMHVFGHGRHGGHSGHSEKRNRSQEKKSSRKVGSTTNLGEHQH